MMKDQWRKRQEQWDRFHEWEAKQPASKLSPAQRLAEIGALVDRALASDRFPKESQEGLARKAKGVILLHKRLAVLNRSR